MNMKKIFGFGVVLPTFIGLMLYLLFIMPVPEAFAGDNSDGFLPVQRVTAEVGTYTQFGKAFQSRITKDGTAIVGPFDIIVGVTDKGANGIKYTNVPFIVFNSHGWVAFPNGDLHKRKAVYVITSNFTIRMKSK